MKDDPTKGAFSSTCCSDYPVLEDTKSKFVVSPNRFEAFATEEPVHISDRYVSPSTEISSRDQSNFKLSNFVLKNVTNFIAPNKDFTRLVSPERFICRANGSSIIARTNTRARFEAVKSLELPLVETDYNYHSFILRFLQPFRVVPRDLHRFIPTADVTNNLSDLGHRAINISNILHRTNKSPLLLFNMHLARNTNNRELFKIAEIFNSSVKFEYPIRSLGPLQYQSCQMYGHTRRDYWNRDPRFVKCVTNRNTGDCTKTRDVPAMCANRDGNHTADLKGCQIFKNIQNRTKDQVEKIKNHCAPTSAVSPAPQFNNAPVSKSNPTYCAQATASTPPVDGPLHFVNKFIEEVKSMLNPFLLALTYLINKITVLISPTP